MLLGAPLVRPALGGEHALKLADAAWIAASATGALELPLHGGDVRLHLVDRAGNRVALPRRAKLALEAVIGSLRAGKLAALLRKRALQVSCPASAAAAVHQACKLVLNAGAAILRVGGLGQRGEWQENAKADKGRSARGCAQPRRTPAPWTQGHLTATHRLLE
ncbi:MAG: hypothetical protein KI785_02885 [Devosiaceae bacterium]|nr:hypothetical protein [Devosiaceae bacterium MH13]